MATPNQQFTDRRAEKSAQAFRTISEVSSELNVPQHVLRFWESKFTQVRPLKRGGGRRYYRPEDIDLLRRIRSLLYDEGYTIKGVQRLLRESRGRFADLPPSARGEPPFGEAIRADLARQEAKAEAQGTGTGAGNGAVQGGTQPRAELPAGPRPSGMDLARRKEVENILSDLQAALKTLRGRRP